MFFFQFYPTSGPVDGGTSVTIEGINLGKVFDDIKDGVVVAGVPCNAIKESYVAAKRFVIILSFIIRNIEWHDNSFLLL